MDADSKRLKEAYYYTVDLSIKSYAIKFSALSIRLINGQVVNLISQFPNAGVTTFGPYESPAQGKVLYGLLDMWKVFPTKKILHIEGNTVYSYAASNPNKASGAFLKNPLNFSPQSQYLRVNGFTHQVINPTATSLRDTLANPADYPDVIRGLWDRCQRFSDTIPDPLFKKLLENG